MHVPTCGQFPGTEVRLVLDIWIHMTLCFKLQTYNAKSIGTLISAPDPPCTHKKKRKESARRGSGAVDTEGLHGM